MKQLIISVNLLLVLFSQINFAQNYNDALILSEPGLFPGARALSMGNSYTALSNDFTGVFFNPAGIGLIKKVQLTGGMYLNSFENNTTFFNNRTDASQNKVNINQFGVIYPVPTLRGSLVFALGYNQAKDFNRIMEFDGFNNANNSMIQDLTGEYNEQVPITNELGLAYEIVDPITEQYIRDTTLIDGLLNQSGMIRKEGSFGKWSFAGSIELVKDFFIGATFNILSGNFKSDSDYREDDTKNNYGINSELVPGNSDTRDFLSFYMNDIIDWDLSGWDANIGFLYNWQNHFRFGAAVKFPSYFTIKETFYVDAYSEFGTGAGFDLEPDIVDNIEYGIRTPFEYSVGLSGTASFITLNGDIRIIDYTQMEFNEGFDSQYRIERQQEIEDLFTTVINYHLGAEFSLTGYPMSFRIGGMYLPSPYNNDPSEYDKKYITAGLGLKFGEIFGVDLAYAYGWWKDFGDNYGVNVSRTYQDISVNNFILSFQASL
jgi:hypothetical protein